MSGVMPWSLIKESNFSYSQANTLTTNSSTTYNCSVFGCVRITNGYVPYILRNSSCVFPGIASILLVVINQSINQSINHFDFITALSQQITTTMSTTTVTPETTADPSDTTDGPTNTSSDTLDTTDAGPTITDAEVTTDTLDTNDTTDASETSDGDITDAIEITDTSEFITKALELVIIIIDPGVLSPKNGAPLVLYKFSSVSCQVLSLCAHPEKDIVVQACRVGYMQ